jgi:dTDP-4-dehydrorhamnose 3,5-epimerase
MTWCDGIIHDVVTRPLSKHFDDRGWLAELHRDDEIAPEFRPAMSYVSVTKPGVTRGPHEHRDQADFFCFLGPGNFRVVLWDGREGSPTQGVRQILVAGEDQPRSVLVPAGVVHAYRNESAYDAWVFNAPNRLYRGPGRHEPVDEIRHEDDPTGPYRM